MPNVDDHARLVAALTIAIQSSQQSAHNNFEQKLRELDSAVRGLDWVITVARDLKVSPLERFDHPWHCAKRKQLLQKLLDQEVPALEANEDCELLARCCAMIELGVDINAKWYRFLRGLVIDSKISKRELRTLLRHPTVWWGTSVKASSGANALSRFLCTLWSMGRPPAGELLVREHHWVTKTALLSALCLTGYHFANASLATIEYFLSHSAQPRLAESVTIATSCGAALWICWWLGPKSWKSTKRLNALLQTQDAFGDRPSRAN